MQGLLVHAISEFEPGRRLVAVTDLSLLEAYADDAFPRGGVIPNSILVEIIAQAASLFLGASHDFRFKAVPILLTSVVFHRTLRPGGRFSVDERVLALEDQTALLRAVGTSEGANVVEAELIMGFGSEDGEWALPANQELQRRYFEMILGVSAAQQGSAGQKERGGLRG
jgi:3-hydroxyacyl-[acyl-carrier-protein] dehydratase